MYLNPTLDLKAKTWSCCTSTNSVEFINVARTHKVIFGPDQNLGIWVAEQINKNYMFGLVDVMHTVELLVLTGVSNHYLFGNSKMVSSSHHQVIVQVPPGYVVSVRSNDGLIKAIESGNGGIIGVQWHPERDKTEQAIIKILNGKTGKI